MQRLIFTNANGETLDLTAKPFFVLSYDGISSAPYTEQTQQTPFTDGDIALDGYFGARTITLSVALYDDGDLKKRYELRDKAIRILNPKIGAGVITYTNNALTRSIKAVPNPPVFPNKNANDTGSYKFTASFVCHNPFWVGAHKTAVIGNGSSVLSNDGEVPSSVKISILSESENPRIINETTGQKIGINGTYSGIEIDTTAGNKTVLLKPLGDANVEGTGNGRDIAYSPELNLYAVVGDGKCATSSDGVRWTARTIPAGTYNALARNGARFVAVGSSVSATSSDGVSWTARTIPTGIYNALAWNGSVFVAIGNGVCATSADGVSWTARTIPTGDYNAIAWNGSRFVAVGDGKCATSSDGITWTARTIPAGTYNAVAWNGSVFVAVGNSVCATSSDGVTWTARTIPAGTYNAVTWDGAQVLFVAVGDSVSAVSSDGMSWTARSIPAGDYRSVRYIIETGMLFAVGDSVCATSSDGVTWDAESGASGVFNAVAYSPELKRFVAVGNSVCATSSDGVTWTARTIPAGTYNALAWNGSRFVAVDGDMGTVSSPDGITWTAGGTVEASYYETIDVRGNTVVASVSGGIGKTLYSEDGGKTWHEANLPQYLVDVAHDSERFVGSAGFIYTSEDGKTWTQSHAGLIPYSASCANGIFFASGYFRDFSDSLGWRRATTNFNNVYYNNYNETYYFLNDNVIRCANEPAGTLYEFPFPYGTSATEEMVGYFLYSSGNVFYMPWDFETYDLLQLHLPFDCVGMAWWNEPMIVLFADDGDIYELSSRTHAVKKYGRLPFSQINMIKVNLPSDYAVVNDTGLHVVENYTQTDYAIHPTEIDITGGLVVGYDGANFYLVDSDGMQTLPAPADAKISYCGYVSAGKAYVWKKEGGTWSATQIVSDDYFVAIFQNHYATSDTVYKYDEGTLSVRVGLTNDVSMENFVNKFFFVVSKNGRRHLYDRDNYIPKIECIGVAHGGTYLVDSGFFRLDGQAYVSRDIAPGVFATAVDFVSGDGFGVVLYEDGRVEYIPDGFVFGMDWDARKTTYLPTDMYHKCARCGDYILFTSDYAITRVSIADLREGNAPNVIVTPATPAQNLRASLHSARSIPSRNGLRSIAYSPELKRFVAVGEKLGTSSDGITWTLRGSDSSMRAVTWCARLGLFVAVGASVCATSSDGMAFIPRSIPARTYNAVAYSPELNLIVAVGDSVCATSSDGVTWISRTIPAGGYGAVAWSPELMRFVAVGDGVSAVSSDGVTWTALELEQPLYSVLWEKTLNGFLAVGDNTFVVIPAPKPTNAISKITDDTDMSFALAIGGNKIATQKTNALPIRVVVEWDELFVGV